MYPMEHIWTIVMLENTLFTRICREFENDAIYGFNPESFCDKNLAIRKVFAFSDSDYNTTLPVLGWWYRLSINNLNKRTRGFPRSMVDIGRHRSREEGWTKVQRDCCKPGQ